MTIVMLLALLASIVDIARWHTAVSQGERMLHLANKAVLSHYNDYLKEEYGIFGIDTGEVDLKTTLVPYLSPTQMIDHIDTQSVNGGPSFVSGQGLDYMDDSIQQFMKLRGPMLLLEPLMDKLGLMQKSGETVKLMEKQQDVMKDGEYIDSLYEKFRNYVEGEIKTFDAGGLKSALAEEPRGARRCYNLKEKLPELKEKLARLKDRRSDLRESLRNITGDDEAADEKRKSLKRKISSVGRNIRSTSSSIENAEKEMAEIERFYRYGVTTILNPLTGNGAMDSLLDKNRKALSMLDELEEETADFRNKVQAFKKESEAGQDQYIDESYQGVMSTVDRMLMALGGQGEQFTEEGNLPLMKERLEKNILLLEGIASDIDAVQASARAIGNLSFSSETAAMSKDNAYEVAAFHLNRKLSAYITDFDFIDGTDPIKVDSQVESNVDSGEDGIMSQLDLGTVLESMDLKGFVLPEDRPSMRLGGDEEDEEASEKGLLDALSGGGGFLDMAGTFKDKAYRNEYAVGMFSMIHERSTDEKEMTLSGFEKSTHPFPGEVEYIMTGISDNYLAVSTFAGILLATRTALNAASLIASGSKQRYIMSIAQGIAGWWTAGIGAMALVVVINLLWAILEAFVDVVLLLKGHRIPLIKTDKTWYTSLNGGWNALMEKGMAEGKKLASDVLDKGAEAVKEFVTEGADRARAASESVRSGIESALDADYASIMDPSLASPSAGDYFDAGTDEYDLLKDILRETASKKANAFPDLESVVKDRADILGKYSGRIDGVIDGIEKEVNGQVDRIVKDMKDDFDLNEARKKLPKTSSGSKGSSGHSIADFVPKFGYKDYCRAWLFFAADENKVLIRMMDLIEYNLRNSSGNAHLNLSKFVYSVKSKAQMKGLRTVTVGVADGY